MVHYQGRELHGERLELGSDEAYYLGPDLVLRDCTLVLRTTAKALTVTRTQLIGCTLEAKKKLTGFRWNRALLKGCRFTGTFADCDFGYWPEAMGPDGGIEDCDLTGATLDGCRFIGCDAATLRFPPWPCFTLLDPYRRAAELTQVQWPGEVGIIAQTFANYPATTAAVTFLATAVAKKFGTSEAQLRATLERLEGIKL